MTKPKAKPSVTKITTVITSKDKALKPAAVKKPAVKVVTPAKKTSPAKKAVPVKKAPAAVQKQIAKPVVPPQVKASVPVKPISKPVKPQAISIKELFQTGLNNPPKVDTPSASPILGRGQQSTIAHVVEPAFVPAKKDKLSFSEVFPLVRR
jgi:hypothetical protein